LETKIPLEILPDSGASAGSYGPSEDSHLHHGGTFDIPALTVDEKGRVTVASTKTMTLPSSGGGSESPIDVILNTTTKSYLLGTSITPTSTPTSISVLNSDVGVYLDTAAGKLTADTFSGNLDGTATKAVSDSSGNNIIDTYSTKSTTLSSISGSLNLNDSKITLTTNTVSGVLSTSDIDITDLVELVNSDLDITIPTYSGATSSSDGVAGLVPPAQSSEKDYFLTGDGSWTKIVLPEDMTNVEYVSAIGTGYIRYGSGLQICFNSVEVTRSDPTFTFSVPFSSVPMVTLTLNETVSRATSVQVKTITTTNFSASVYSNTHTAGSVNYIAIGVWK